MEIKYRIEAIDDVLEGKVRLRSRIAEEFCYLQLRLICEIIAVGCLIIHGDLKPSADLLKAYNADWILKKLSQLHPKFYPTPLENEDVPGNTPAWVHKSEGYLTEKELGKLWSQHSGPKLHRGNSKTVLSEGYLTQKELGKLWGQHSGPKLHRGNSKTVLSESNPPNISSVREWRNKIVQLLNRHTITSPDKKTVCYFGMQDEKGEVHSNIFQAIEEW